MHNIGVEEAYRKAMYMFPDVVPVYLKNLIDSWVGETYLNILLQRDFKIKIVVDANILISETVIYFKKGKSHFFELLRHEIIEPISPKYIVEEIEEHMDEIVRKTKRTKEEIWNTLNTMYFSRIKLMDVDGRGKEGYSKLIERLREKDPDDIQYLLLYLSEDADAILSRDNHFIRLGGILTFENVGRLKGVLYDIERGNLAMLITVDALPKMALYLGRIIMTVLFVIMKALYDLAVKVIEVIKDGIDGLVEWFSNLTPEGKLLASLCGVVSLLSLYEYREWIKRRIVDPVKEKIQIVIRRAVELFKKIGGLLKDLVYVAAKLVMLMLDTIDNCIEIYETLGTKIQELEVFESG